MKTLLLVISTVLAGVAFTNASATGLYTCDSGARSSWKTMDQLKTKITEDGWQVRFVKEDGGCYEVYGTSPEGQRVEAYFHPVTLEKMLVARRGQILFEKGAD